MKHCLSLLPTLLLGCLLIGGTLGCKSNSLEKAQTRSQKLEPQMTLSDVYKLLGTPQETFAEAYVWEYYWPGDNEGRLLRVEFEELDGQWVVREWRWK